MHTHTHTYFCKTSCSIFKLWSKFMLMSPFLILLPSNGTYKNRSSAFILGEHHEISNQNIHSSIDLNLKKIYFHWLIFQLFRKIGIYSVLLIFVGKNYFCLGIGWSLALFRIAPGGQNWSDHLLKPIWSSLRFSKKKSAEQTLDYNRYILIMCSYLKYLKYFIKSIQIYIKSFLFIFFFMILP